VGSVTADSLDLIWDELTAYDRSRERSQQSEPGASQLGSCRAAVLFRGTGAEPSDPRMNLAALMGTAFHAVAEAAADWDDVTEKRYSYRGVPCTLDRYWTRRDRITDLKTVKTAEDVEKVRREGPSRRQRWQVQVGAAAAIEAGLPVKWVEILYLPRAGGSKEDCFLWVEEFDRGVADEAAAWHAEQMDRIRLVDGPATSADVDGLRDERMFFCRDYCEFFTVCRGADALPSDEDYADAAARYDVGKRSEKAARELKREAAAELAGFVGTAGGFKVTQVSGSSSFVLDTDAIAARAADWELVTGEPLPVRESFRSGHVNVSRAR
jgi:hypothetical protein